jgi:hypothetical protein
VVSANENRCIHNTHGAITNSDCRDLTPYLTYDCAPSYREKLNLCLKSSLRYLQELPNLIFALSSTAVCNKKKTADRVVCAVGNYIESYFYLPIAIYCQQLYVIKKRPQIELCALLAIT